MDNISKRLKAFAKEAMQANAAFSRLGQDDSAYDTLALARIAKAMVKGLKDGQTPEYDTYAGPSPEGMDQLLETPLTTEVAEAWLVKATVALEDIS